MSTEDDPIFRFQFVLDEEADRATVQAALREQFAKLDGVEEARVSGPTRAVDPLTVITVTVLVLRGAGEAVDALRGLVRAIKELAAEMEGIKASRLEVGTEVRDIEQVKDIDLKDAARFARS